MHTAQVCVMLQTRHCYVDWFLYQGVNHSNFIIPCYENECWHDFLVITSSYGKKLYIFSCVVGSCICVRSRPELQLPGALLLSRLLPQHLNSSQTFLLVIALLLGVPVIEVHKLLYMCSHTCVGGYVHVCVGVKYMYFNIMYVKYFLLFVTYGIVRT